MLKKRKIVRGIIVTILLICTAYIIYSIVNDPLDTSILVPAIVVTAGFYALGNNTSKK